MILGPWGVGLGKIHVFFLQKMSKMKLEFNLKVEVEVEVEVGVFSLYINLIME